jgi:hypothetical protein
MTGTGASVTLSVPADLKHLQNEKTVTATRFSMVLRSLRGTGMDGPLTRSPFLRSYTHTLRQYSSVQFYADFWSYYYYFVCTEPLPVRE